MHRHPALKMAESGDESSLGDDAWKPDWMPKMELSTRRNDRPTDSSLNRQTDGWSKNGITLGRVGLLNHDNHYADAIAELGQLQMPIDALWTRL